MSAGDVRRTTPRKARRGPSLEAELAELERTDPAVAKAAQGLEVMRLNALAARIKVLEGHRDQWRIIAFRLYDAATQVLADNFDGRARTPLTKSWADLVAAVEQLEDSDANDGTRP